MSRFQPQSKCDSDVRMLFLLATRFTALVVCGVNVSCLSRVTPSRNGFGLNLTGALLMVRTDFYLASGP